MFARGDGCAIAVPPCFGLLPGISARVPAWVGGWSSLAGRMSRFQPRQGLSCLRTGRGATASRVIPIQIQYTCPAAACQVWRGGFAAAHMGPACRRRSGTPGRGGMESGRPARLQTCRPAQCGSRPTQWPASCVIRRPGWLPPGTHSRCQGATGWRGCQILRPRPTRRFQTTRCR